MRQATPHRIVSDDSGHNYACPADQVEAFYAWLETEAAELGDEPPMVTCKIEGTFEFYLYDTNDTVQKRDRNDPNSCAEGKTCDHHLCRWSCRLGKSDT
jgi:hypothetical protein